MDDRTRQFEAIAMPHLNAAYNLARWLLRDDHAAEDVVQEAYLRALRYFASFHGGDARPWLFGIVRNACWTWLRDNRGAAQTLEYDEERDAIAPDAVTAPAADNPETLLARKQDGARVNAAIEALPAVFREALILREVEELPYADIARITGVPPGTVMSRLSRGRRLLRTALCEGGEGSGS